MSAPEHGDAFSLITSCCFEPLTFNSLIHIPLTVTIPCFTVTASLRVQQSMTGGVGVAGRADISQAG